MFTGLIREFGEVLSFENDILKIKAKHDPNIGDSIAVNGICLTVVGKKNGEFSLELSYESRQRVAVENLQNKVHIEPAMKLSDRLDGHIVQGHIDGIGEIKSIKKYNNALDFIINLNDNLMPFMIEKGSVAIDGVSLTINEVFNNSIRLTIIPHTFKNTLFQSYKIKRRVNVESDLFARYIYNIINRKKSPSWQEIDQIIYSY